MSTELPAPSPELLAFQRALAGRYSIERELGRGGMGIVFLAREVALDRLVALKLLPPAVAARPGVKERFLREARTAARLSHPNIVQVYTVDEVGGFVFFAMAYVDGGTLGDRIRTRGPLSNSEAVRMLRDVSWALAHAHVQGIVHRDVKPDNILFDTATGRSLVTDFGIAVAAADGDDSGHASQVVGTADFMSPEQAKGGAVDARSDLYSLACVGFLALSGKTPFEGPTASAILVKHVSEPAPSVLSAAPHAPPPVASALDRCLRKDPEQRFRGGDALADALLPHLELDRELPVPVRVFIKQSREWENVLAWNGLGLILAFPLMMFAAADDAPGGVLLALILFVATLGIPIAYVLKAARKLLSSGFTQSDATAAFLRDIARREEEYRFQVGDRVTWLDETARAAKVLGLGGAAMGLLGALFGGGGGEGLSYYLLAMGFPTGFGGLLVQELRARSRGDVMGERYLRFWKSRLGRWLFKLAGVNLERVAPALSSGVHRPTEVVIGLEADRLFEELPRDVRRTLAGLPETVRALEDDAQAMRGQVAEMEAILAELGDDDPSRPSAAERARVRASVSATRDEAKEKLRQAVTALETIRLNLLYMHAGSGTVESLTMELQAAQGLSDDMANLLEGHREVERILNERRQTGFFKLVTSEQ